MIPNKGQWDSRIAYNIDLNGGKMYIEKGGMTFFFTDAMQHNHNENHLHENDSITRYHAIKQRFINGNSIDFTEQNWSSESKNYILGNDPTKWKSNIHGCSNLLQKSILNGVDIRYKGTDESLMYQYEIQPNASTSDLGFMFEGASNIHIDEDKNLIIEHRFGTIIQSRPLAWNIDESGKKKSVACEFKIEGNSVRFIFPMGYNPNQQLIIDPSLTFSTFSGSSSDNWGFTATPDPNGNLFGGGIVFGSGYPTSSGAYDLSFNGGTGSFPMDVGITKFNATGTSLLFSTYLGGSGNETPHSIICAPNGELFIYGVTSSSNFPMAGSPYDNTFNGGPNTNQNSLDFNGSDIYIARLNPSGTSLIASTFIGGSNTDGLNTNSLAYNYGDQFRGEIMLDANQNVYIASTTASSNFPTTAGNQTSISGAQDAVIFKMPANLSTLIWSTYFGGSGLETGNSITVNGSGAVYVVGGTSSFTLPISSGNDLSFNGGMSDGYVVRLNASNGNVMSGTFMGMDEYDQTYFVETDIDDFVYVYGQTESSWPITPGKFGLANSGQFIRKYTNDLINIAWTTMIGGGHGHVEISPTAFLVSDCYDIYIAGWGGTLNSMEGQAANSTSSGFPCTSDGFQQNTNGSNFYIAVLSQDAVNLKYGTYMGGVTSSYNHVDGGTSRFDKSGRIYHAVCGACGGNAHGFTSTPGSWSPTNQSSNCNMATFKFELSTIDAIAAAINPDICIPQTATFHNTSIHGNQYHWDFGDGTSSTAFEPTHAYTTPGTYTIKLVVSDQTGCFSADSTYITINVGSFNAGVTQTQGAICPGQSVQLDAYGGSTYNWTPAAFLDNPNIANPIATVTQTTTFSVTISDSCGSITQNVTVNVIQNNLTVSNDTSICRGASVPLFANTNGSVSWSPPTFLDNPSSYTPISIPDTAIVYHITSITPEGCTLNDSVRIMVYSDLPTAHLPDTMDMCRGSQISILAFGGDNYLWTPNDHIDDVNAALVTVNPTENQLYVCQISNACGSILDSVFIQIVSAEITAGNDTVICPREVATLWATGAQEYFWSPVNTVVSQTANYVQVKPTQTTDYMVVGKDVHGCYDTAYVQVVLHPTPTIDITPTVYAFLDDEVQLEAITHVPGTLTWSPLEYLSCVNCSNPIATPNKDITYYVDFVDINGCKASSYVSIKYDVVVYVPNTFIPNGDDVNDVFKVYGGNIKEMECLIFNRWGELICTLDSIDDAWDGTYKGKKCQDGTYTWKLTYKDTLNHKHLLTGHVNLLR